MKTCLYIILAITLVSGCSETELVEDMIEGTPLLETTWNLTVLNQETMQLPDTRVPYLRFDADEVTGYDGCNSFDGPYTVEGDTLTFGDLMSTLVACLGINELDIQFRIMLESTNRYQISGNQLHLFNEAQVLASFIAAEQT